MTAIRRRRRPGAGVVGLPRAPPHLGIGVGSSRDAGVPVAYSPSPAPSTTTCTAALTCTPPAPACCSLPLHPAPLLLPPSAVHDSPRATWRERRLSRAPNAASRSAVASISPAIVSATLAPALTAAPSAPSGSPAGESATAPSLATYGPSSRPLIAFPSDTLKRHVAMHGDAGLVQYNQAHPRTSACQGCSRSKQRCDGAEPCQTCRDRGRECVYASSAAAPDPLPVTEGVAEPGLYGPVTPSAVLGETGEVRQGGISDPAWDDFLFSAPSQSFDFSSTPFPMDASFAEPWSADDLAGTSLLDFSQGHGNLTPAPSRDHERGSLAGTTALEPEEDDALESERIHHVSSPAVETYIRMQQFFHRIAQDDDLERPGSETCPSLRHVDVYIQLYFEHFHPRWPLLHKPTFGSDKTSWLLALSVAAVGSVYSRCGMQALHYTAFERAALAALRMDVRGATIECHVSRLTECVQSHEFPTLSLLDYAQSLLVLQHFLIFTGSRRNFFHVNRYRYSLSMICRQLSRQHGTLFFGDLRLEPQGGPWERWVQTQAKHRLTYFTLGKWRGQ